jgi:magnesium transporter
VYVVDPSESELDALVRLDGLERDLLQDAIDPNEVPRIQHEREVSYFFLRAPSGSGDQAQTVPLLIAVAPTFVLTVSRQPFTWLEHFLHGPQPYSTEWRSQLLWRIMMELNARYQVALNDISKHVRADLASIQNIRNEDLVRLVQYGGVLNDLLGSLAPMNTMLTNIMGGKLIKTYDADKDLMEDVVLGNGQVMEGTRSQLRTTANFREAYSLVTANELNKFIKLLTSLSLIMTVPNLVVNFWSMNIALPLQHNPHMFAFMVASTLAMIAALAITFRKRRLL